MPRRWSKPVAKGLEGLVSGLQRAVLGKSTYSEAKRAGPELWPCCSMQDKLLHLPVLHFSSP